MTIKKKLDNLYDKFGVGRKFGVKCGVVDEKKYLRQRIKIVFLLKEPNSDAKDWVYSSKKTILILCFKYFFS